jgi:hypothetical protein
MERHVNASKRTPRGRSTHNLNGSRHVVVLVQRCFPSLKRQNEPFCNNHATNDPLMVQVVWIESTRQILLGHKFQVRWCEKNPFIIMLEWFSHTTVS